MTNMTNFRIPVTLNNNSLAITPNRQGNQYSFYLEKLVTSPNSSCV